MLNPRTGTLWICRVGYRTRVSVDLGSCGWSWNQSPEDTYGQLYNQNPSQTMNTQSEDWEGHTAGRFTVIVAGVRGAQTSKMGEKHMNLWKRAQEHLSWIFMKYLIRKEKKSRPWSGSSRWLREGRGAFVFRRKLAFWEEKKIDTQKEAEAQVGKKECSCFKLAHKKTTTKSSSQFQTLMSHILQY